MRISAFLENIELAVKETGTTLEAFLTLLKQEGLESVYANYSWNVKPREAELMELFRKLGLSLEGLWENLDLNTMTDEEADAASKALIDCAARNGAKHVLISPGMFKPQGGPGTLTREEVAEREPELQKMIEGIRRAKEYGDRVGVAVTMEDYDVFGSPIVFPEVLRRFFEEIPGLQCSFDTGNFIPCDADGMEQFAYYKDRIATLHLKDRVENDDQNGTERTPFITESGRKYYPAVTGCGEMHIPEIIGEMNRMGYTGGGIVEFFGCTDTANKILESVRWMKANADRC